MLQSHFKKKILNFLKSIFYRAFKSNSSLCHIEEIDLVRNVIVIHCRGVDAPIKLSFDEIINDSVMLSNFSSKHASWIGYYYGKYYKGLVNQKRHCNIPFSFSQTTPHEKCSVTMVTRHGNLVYVNHATNTTHTMHPIRIMANKDLIMRFEPMQACYIGILSGISEEKISNPKSSSLPRAMQLKLVK